MTLLFKNKEDQSCSIDCQIILISEGFKTNLAGSNLNSYLEYSLIDLCPNLDTSCLLTFTCITILTVQEGDLFLSRCKVIIKATFKQGLMGYPSHLLKVKTSLLN